MRTKKSKRLHWLSWLFGVAVLAVVIVAARHFSDARDFALLVARAHPWWLGVAVVLQAATYIAQGQIFRVVAKADNVTLRLPSACGLSVAKLFVDQAVPSGGLSGTAVLANGLQRRGLPRPVVAAAVVVNLASFYAAYVLCLIVSLVVAARGPATGIIVLVALTFSAFGIALSVLILRLSGRGKRAVAQRLAWLGPLRSALAFVSDADPRLARNPRLLLIAAAYQLAVVLCDAATVWVLIRSLGGYGAPAGVFASFVLSSLLHTIAIVPGGLGTYEAASLVTLRMIGVPVAVALAATLLFRGLSFWLPMLPGIWISRRETRALADGPTAKPGRKRARLSRRMHAG